MNKEYILLSDGKVAVSNENGNIQTRDVKNKKLIERTLTYENKLEIINNQLKDLNKELADGKGVIFLCENMIKVQPLLITLVTLVGFVLGGLFNAGNFISYGIYYGLAGLVYSSILASVPLIGGKILKSKFSKKIVGLEGAIEKAQRLKLACEKELSEIKESSATHSESERKINEPISLELKNKVASDNIQYLLNNAYETTINNTPKKLTLKKNK